MLVLHVRVIDSEFVGVRNVEEFTLYFCSGFVERTYLISFILKNCACCVASLVAREELSIVELMDIVKKVNTIITMLNEFISGKTIFRTCATVRRVTEKKGDREYTYGAIDVKSRDLAQYIDQDVIVLVLKPEEESTTT